MIRRKQRAAVVPTAVSPTHSLVDIVFSGDIQSMAVELSITKRKKVNWTWKLEVCAPQTTLRYQGKPGMEDSICKHSPGRGWKPDIYESQDLQLNNKP